MSTAPKPELVTEANMAILTAISDMRTTQREHTAALAGLAVACSTTAEATSTLVVLRQAQEAREIRAEDRAQATSDRRWSWWQDNWKLLAAVGLAVAAPDALTRVLEALGLGG